MHVRQEVLVARALLVEVRHAVNLIQVGPAHILGQLPRIHLAFGHEERTLVPLLPTRRDVAFRFSLGGRHDLPIGRCQRCGLARQVGRRRRNRRNVRQLRSRRLHHQLVHQCRKCRSRRRSHEDHPQVAGVQILEHELGAGQEF